jgi:hypothetical protein
MPRVMRAPIPVWRTLAAWSIRGLGITIGAVLAAVYLLLMWDIDWPHARLGTVIALYLVFPLLLLVGPIWLFGWIAAFVAPPQPTREADL